MQTLLVSRTSLGGNKMRKVFGFVLTGLFGLFPSQSIAVTNDVEFNANVTHTCAITVTRDGILDPRSNFTRLTSRSGPGRPGRANVTATGNTFTVSVEAPVAFDTQPAADTTPETFRAWHRSNGATVYGITQTPQTINMGLSRVRIHMDARKTSGDVFEAGNYSATVILRCE